MDIFNTIADIVKSQNDLYIKQRELAAIWLSSPVITAQGKTSRIAPDMLVTIKDGCLVDGERPTHKVLACFGTLINQFEITVIDLFTNEPNQIKL
jgi:hypothetical protein